jgi:hypothetical protein
MKVYRSLNFHSLYKYYYWQTASFVSEGPILALESIFSIVAEYKLVRIIWLSVSQSVNWTCTVRNLPDTEQKLSSEKN